MLRLRLLLLALPFPLLGAMAAVDATGGHANQGVAAGVVPGNATDHRTFQATFGLGAISRNNERSSHQRGNDDFHDDDPS